MRILGAFLLLMSFAVRAEEPKGMLFGTLLTDHPRAQEEFAAGVRVVHLELGWREYEPRDGEFSEAYAASAKRRLAAFREAGMKVVLGTGLQYPPRWVLDLPGGRYVDQDGATAKGVANLTFCAEARRRAERFLTRVAADLGTDFWAVRVGSGGYVECFYPPADGGQSHNSYWCYDVAAQAACPLPGWKPGEKTYKGEALAVKDVERWYAWYLGAMVDGINRQIGTYRRLGYRGDIHILMPGVGTRPRGLTGSIENYLAQSADPLHTTARAAVWHRVIDVLPADRTGLVIYCSSVADGSGHNDLTTPDDVKRPLDDREIERWSAARYVAYLADRAGLAKSGENPGRGDAPGYGPEMLKAAMAQAKAAGYGSFLWAHDHNLYDGTGPTLAAYGTMIVRQSK